MLVALAAVGAAAGAATVALVAARQGEAPEAPAPPLELGVLPVDGPEAAALQAAERSYDEGDRAAALERFEAVLRRDPGSLPAAVGAALARWPEGSLERLEELVAEHPGSGVVRLHLGLALFVTGDEQGARDQWQEAERRDPDTPAAVRAGDLRHPEMPPGLPFFVPGGGTEAAGLEDLPPRGQLAELRRRAEMGGVRDWLLYGAVLQRLGRPVSAREAYRRALVRAPADLEAATADAVGRFDKDDPSAAFSLLGPLSRANPRSAVVQFHFGLVLLWLARVDEARRHLEAARTAGAGTVWEREAGRLLDRLEDVGTPSGNE